MLKCDKNVNVWLIVNVHMITGLISDANADVGAFKAAFARGPDGRQIFSQL